MNFYPYNGKIEHSDEIDIPYYIQVTVRVLPTVINNIEALNQAIQRTEFDAFMEISPLSLMKIPYRSRDAYTTTYHRRVNKTIYQLGRHHNDDELGYFFNTLEKVGYLVQINDRQAWDVEVERL
ncbi:hypothetical protein PCO86_05525 [Pectobacteriaceae bacterium CE70]|nr:hypothetical protein PCO87_05370 [Pectobacteriaceae bacterium C52]WJV67888.1 hypothetical protein PCO86_05525 [Pectobacteriaceae bacterium CE70]WJY11831.1 hypothetical protein PCO80_05345 [Pectobacteriaceae bacterium C80]